MAEHSAVNRRVVGSSPTCGAKDLMKAVGTNSGGLFCFISVVGFTESCEIVDFGVLSKLCPDPFLALCL